MLRLIGRPACLRMQVFFRLHVRFVTTVTRLLSPKVGKQLISSVQSTTSTTVVVSGHSCLSHPKRHPPAQEHTLNFKYNTKLLPGYWSLVSSQVTVIPLEHTFQIRSSLPDTSVRSMASSPVWRRRKREDSAYGVPLRGREAATYYRKLDRAVNLWTRHLDRCVLSPTADAGQ